MKARKVLLFLIVMIIGGCNFIPGVSGKTNTYRTPSGQTPTPSQISSEMTPIQTPPLQVPDRSIETRCVDNLDTSPAAFGAAGVIVVKDYQQGSQLVFIRIAYHDRLLLHDSQAGLSEAAVSPTGKFLAYQGYVLGNKSAHLIITDAGSHEVTSLQWQDDWEEITGWLNDEQLVIMERDLSSEGKRLVILNPFTQESKFIKFDELPDYPLLKRPWLALDPTGERVLYPQYDVQVLFDLMRHEIIAEIPAWIEQDPRNTAWSPDGNYAAINARASEKNDSSEIYVVSRDGNLQELTHLSDAENGITPSQPSWSPDGKQIAIWVWGQNGNDPNFSLAIINWGTGHVTDLCISSNPSFYGGPYHELLPSPIWSPDGKQLLVEQRYNIDHSRVILVDLVRNSAVSIYEDARPIGWLVK